jgi:putative flippase GtrA
VAAVTSRLQRVWEWAHTHEGRKLVRFTSVSAISTVVSYACITVFVGTGWVSDAVTATIYGNLIATIPSYQLNRSWTWGKKGRSHIRREVIPFWSMSALGIAFSTFLAMYARDLINTHHLHHLIAGFLTSSFNLVSFGIFWLLKLWLFNRIFKVDVLADMDEHLSLEERAARDGRPA